MPETICRCTTVDEGETANLFYVYNTSNRKMMILAQNRATAVYFARAYGHVKDVANARAVKIKCDGPSAAGEKFFASVRAAIKSGRQGVVQDLDGFAVGGEGSQAKTFTPIVEVHSK